MEQLELLRGFQQSWSRLKYWVMSRSQQAYNEIRFLAKGNQWTSIKQQRYEEIIEELQTTMPTEQTLTVTYQHIWGYFKKQVTPAEKRRYEALMMKNKTVAIIEFDTFFQKLTKKYSQPYLAKIYWINESPVM